MGEAIFKIPKKHLFQIHKLVSPMLSDVKVQVTRGGFVIEEIDYPRISLINLKLSKRAFKKYAPRKLKEFWLNLNLLGAFLETFKFEDLVTIKIGYEDGCCPKSIEFKATKSGLYTLSSVRQIEEKKDRANRAKLDLEYQIRFSVSNHCLRDMLNIISRYDDQVIFKFEKAALFLQAEDRQGLDTMTIEDLKVLSGKSCNATSRYAIDNLMGLSKGIHKNCHIIFSLRDDYIIKAEYGIKNLHISGTYYLAPRIEQPS